MENLNNFENSREHINLNEWLWENSKSANIFKIENILNPDSFEKQNELSEQIEKCCKNLNNIFAEEFAKKWIDFNLALQTKVPNFIW